MAALPYIQLYAADYLADTIHLTLEEHGAYLLLILNYWQRGVPLLDDDNRLAAICRIPIDNWLSLRPGLEEFFQISGGKWLHKRIEIDLKQVSKQLNQRIAAGKASANARKRKENSTVVEQPLNDRYNSRSANKDTDTDTDKDQTLSSSRSVNDQKRKPVPYVKIVELYHKILPELPECKKITEKRKGYMRARWADGLPDLDTWEKFFTAIRESKFLMGNTPPSPGRTKSFIADLEWITNSTNYTKIYEGKYYE